MKTIMEITSDEKCIRILTEVGILGRFVAAECEHPRHGVYCTIFKTKIEGVDSFVFACNQWGHANAEDNGYYMLCLPWSQWSAAEAAAMFTDWQTHAIAAGPVRMGTFEVPQPA